MKLQKKQTMNMT
jgi:hypothetical protein